MKYKAIGFDWGGVINGQPGTNFAEAAAKKLGISQNIFLDSYYKHNTKFNRGDISAEQLWKLVCRDLGQPNKQNTLLEMQKKYNADSLNNNVLSLVDQLRQNGYKVGLLSNNTLENEAIMLKNGLDKHFDIMHISADTKLVKPDPKAFLFFAEALGVQINELIFIDDSMKSLSTAKQCGYTPILYESYNKLLKDLAVIGVI